MTPVVAFVVFSTYHALNGELNVPSVFYALRCGWSPVFSTFHTPGAA